MFRSLMVGRSVARSLGALAVKSMSMIRISNTRSDPPVTAVPVQLTEKCMVLVLALYGGARRMHAVHASALRYGGLTFIWVHLKDIGKIA